MGKVYDLPRISGFLVIVGLVLGIDISAMAVFISSDYFNRYFHYPSAFEQGMVSGAHPMGGLAGCVLFGYVGERVSRLGCFRYFTFIWIIGCIVSVLVMDIYMVAIGRFIKGVAVGSLSVVASVYLVEIFPSNRKGIATALVQLTLTFGIFLMYMLCWTFSRFNNHMAFRISWGLEIIPAVALISGTLFVPESPRWFVMQGQYKKAQEILTLLNCRSKNDFNKQALLNMYGDTAKARLRDLIKLPYIKQLIMGMTIQALVQFTGINVVMYYVVYICEMAGLEGREKMNVASIPYLLNILFTFIPLHFLDRVQRKVLIVYGSLALAAIMNLIGLTMWIYGHDVPPINGNPALVWRLSPLGGQLTIALCFAFIAIFAGTLSCAGWLYTNEVLADKIRSRGLSICMSISWICNAVLTFLSPLMMSTLKWGTFFLFGMVTTMLTIIVWLAFPETLGMSSSPPRTELYEEGNTKPIMETKEHAEIMENELKVASSASMQGQSTDTEELVEISYRSAAPPPESINEDIALPPPPPVKQKETLAPKKKTVQTQIESLFAAKAAGHRLSPEDEDIMITLTAISSDFSGVSLRDLHNKFGGSRRGSERDVFSAAPGFDINGLGNVEGK
ncbi:AaceriABR223Cp [[Ashbya] aceris (nom. inval.)]|nr:AaceriABR223Cp [[Ashbya] aceris (nom. inval.)]